MAIPLRHFVVGLGFLVAGFGVGLAGRLGYDPGLLRLAHLHVLLAGWVCLTIMGAMTQFVPVWSGVPLHSRRLATAQLWLVAGGLTGFAAALTATFTGGMIAFGGVMVAGFWLFVYNLGCTLWSLDGYDVTERHFCLALAFFVLATGLGFSLAVSYTTPVFGRVGLSRSGAVGAHATLAVFGAVLATVIGALYQLATMFTGADLDGIAGPIQRFEAVGYPVGVALLAGGRLLSTPAAAQLGGLLVATSLCGVGIVLIRCLWKATVDWTPMLSRYAVVAGSLVAWSGLAVPHWGRDVLGSPVRFGAPGTTHLLAFGVIGFVVLGTLYHVVPFIIWVHRYSDRLGYEPVPMIDDLYSDRIAMADFCCLFVGLCLLTVAGLVDAPTVVAAGGGVASLLGALLFVTNMLSVMHRHSPQPIRGVMFPSLVTEEQSPSTDNGGGHGEPEQPDESPRARSGHESD